MAYAINFLQYSHFLYMVSTAVKGQNALRDSLHQFLAQPTRICLPRLL
jgi:hypothetical protein